MNKLFITIAIVVFLSILLIASILICLNKKIEKRPCIELPLITGGTLTPETTRRIDELLLDPNPLNHLAAATTINNNLLQREPVRVAANDEEFLQRVQLRLFARDILQEIVDNIRNFDIPNTVHIIDQADVLNEDIFQDNIFGIVITEPARMQSIDERRQQAESTTNNMVDRSSAYLDL